MRTAITQCVCVWPNGHRKGGSSTNGEANKGARKNEFNINTMVNDDGEPRPQCFSDKLEQRQFGKSFICYAGREWWSILFAIRSTIYTLFVPNVKRIFGFASANHPPTQCRHHIQFTKNMNVCVLVQITLLIDGSMAGEWIETSDERPGEQRKNIGKLS